MAVQRASFIGRDQILDGYDTLSDKAACYSVWQSSKYPMFQYSDDDKAAGRELLNDMLMAGEQNENSDVIIIKFHPKGKDFINEKTPVIASMICRCVPYERGDYNANPKSGLSGTGGLPYSVQRSLESISGLPAMFTAMEERLKALETVEDVPEVDPVEKYLGYLNNPVIAGIAENLIKALAPVIQQLVPGAAAPAPAPMRVAGAPEVPVNPRDPETNKVVEPGVIEFNPALLDSSLERLNAAGCRIDTDLSLLADMAEKNPQMFQMLLLQLRNQ